MFFKNCYVYQLDKEYQVNKDSLIEGLSALAFKPIGANERHCSGWVTPYTDNSESLVHDNGDCMLFALRRDEKVLPSATVNQKVREKVHEIQAREFRKVYKKEERRLREEVIESLLPQAMFNSHVTLGYIDIKAGLVVVDSGNQKAATEFTEMLRKAAISFPIVPMFRDLDLSITLKSWLINSPPHLFTIGDECELKALDESGTITIKGHDVTHEDFINLMDDRVLVNKLSLNWKEDISFILNSDGSMRRLRFSDGVKEEAGHYEADDYIGQFDADFSVLSLSLRELINSLMEVNCDK